MKDSAGAAEAPREGGGAVEVYRPEEVVRDDLLELLAEVSDHFGYIDRALHDASQFRVFFLTLRFLRDSTWEGYFFVTEWDRDTGLWAVGYRRKSRRGRWRKLKDILVHDQKVDAAVMKMMEVLREAVVEEGGVGATDA